MEIDIGGLFHAKQSLTEATMHPITAKRVYNNSTITLSKGILLFGPLACGKSHLIPALAKKCNLSLITAHGPAILDKVIGSSESKISSIFHQTTSRHNVIDNTLTRPSHLDQHLRIVIPSTLQEQKDIILTLSKDLIFEFDALQLVQSDLIFEEVKHCQHCTPTHWKAVFDTSYLNAVHSTVLRTISNASTGIEKYDNSNSSLSLSDKEVIERFAVSMKHQNDDNNNHRTNFVITATTHDGIENVTFNANIMEKYITI